MVRRLFWSSLSGQTINWCKLLWFNRRILQVHVSKSNTGIYICFGDPQEFWDLFAGNFPREFCFRSGFLSVFLLQPVNKSRPNGLICHGGTEARIDQAKSGSGAKLIYDGFCGIYWSGSRRESTAEWCPNVQVIGKRPRKPPQADHGVSANSSHHHTPEPEIGQQEAASEEVGRMGPDFGVEARGGHRQVAELPKWRQKKRATAKKPKRRIPNADRRGHDGQRRGHDGRCR